MNLSTGVVHLIDFIRINCSMVDRHCRNFMFTTTTTTTNILCSFILLVEDSADETSLFRFTWIEKRLRAIKLIGVCSSSLLIYLINRKTIHSLNSNWMNETQDTCLFLCVAALVCDIYIFFFFCFWSCKTKSEKTHSKRCIESTIYANHIGFWFGTLCFCFDLFSITFKRLWSSNKKMAIKQSYIHYTDTCYSSWIEAQKKEVFISLFFQKKKKNYIKHIWAWAWLWL